MEGVSDKNPMSSNITMSFVIISIWLASERKITPEQMSQVMERALEINPVLCNIDYITMSMMHSRLIREHTVAEGAGICDYWTVGDKVAEPK